MKIGKPAEESGTEVTIPDSQEVGVVKPRQRKTFPVDKKFTSAFTGGPALGDRKEIEKFYQDPRHAAEAKMRFDQRYEEAMKEIASKENKKTQAGTEVDESQREVAEKLKNEAGL